MTLEVKNKPQLQGFLSTGKVSADIEFFKKGKRKVQGVPQSQTAAFPSQRGRGNRQI